MSKRVDILKQILLLSTGEYYEINLTKNLVPGIMYQVIDGKKYSINEKLGLEENASFSEVISCWSSGVSEEEKEIFFDFFDASSLISKYNSGQEHVCHTYWTTNVLGGTMLAEQHIFMYDNGENGDVMAFTYVLDITERFNEELYKKELESRLNESSVKLETEKKYLNVLYRNYILAYHLDVYDKIAEVLVLNKRAHAWKMPKIYQGASFDYDEHIAEFEKLFIVGGNKEFLEKLDRKYIANRMRTCGRFAFRMECIPNVSGNRHFEVQVVRVNESAFDGRVIIVSEEIDDTVLAEQRHEHELEKQLERERNQNEVLTALGNSFYTIFKIDLENDFCEKLRLRDEVKHFYKGTDSAVEELENFCTKFVAPEHRDTMKCFLNLDTLSDRMIGKEAIEAECMTTDGEWRRIRFIEKRREKSGKLSHALYITHLISDEKNHEERLVSMAEAAKAANEAKTDFISRVAHDIRTPMNSLFGFLQIAEANIDNSEKLKYSLQKIRVAGEFLNELVNDVLDISKMENGKMTLKAKEISIKALFEELPTSMEGADLGKEIKFDYNLHDVYCDRVIGDPLRLKQIYTNILSNAVKYTPNGGKIEFEVYEEETGNPDFTHLVVKVSDNGIGMSEEFMEKMFSKFERETDTRLNSVSGYGLGLAIVKQLVDLMDGEIEVDSAIGKGSVFTVRLQLPCVVSEEEDQRVKKDYAKKCKDMNLLVAEDNELSREVMKELLLMNGIKCDVVNDGAECVELFKERDGGYDAVLLDVQMPNMNGRDAAKHIRAMNMPSARTVPIIAMTANALYSDIRDCIEAGMNKHLAKPIDINKLLKTLAKLKNDK